MQLGHNDLGGGNPLFLMDIHGYSPPIIRHRYAVIGMNFHMHMVGMFGQSFIDAVIHNLIDHMMKPAAIIGIANIHARAFANCL